MIKQLAHVCFFSDQAEEMVKFYRETLGFPLAFVMKTTDGQTPFGWYVDCGNDTFVEIFDQAGAVQEWGGEVVDLKLAKVGQYRHLCFESEQLEDLRTQLVGQGVVVTEIKKGMDHSFQCWIKDPDGNDIELMMYTSDSLQFSHRR